MRKGFVIIIIGLLATLLVAGCTQTRYVTVPEYHTEYVVRTDSVLLHDSVHVKDSVILYRQGDTVYRETYRDRLMWRDRWRVHTDTVSVRDSIRVEVPVERSQSAWELWKGRALSVLLFAAIVAAGALLFRYAWRKV